MIRYTVFADIFGFEIGPRKPFNTIEEAEGYKNDCLEHLMATEVYIQTEIVA